MYTIRCRGDCRGDGVCTLDGHRVGGTVGDISTTGDSVGAILVRKIVGKLVGEISKDGLSAGVFVGLRVGNWVGLRVGIADTGAIGIAGTGALVDMKLMSRA